MRRREKEVRMDNTYQLDYRRNPAHLKIHLLSDGLRVHDSFYENFTSKYQKDHDHYSKQITFTKRYPHQMILPQNTDCAINQDKASPWELRYDSGGFVIAKDDEIISPVEFPEQYPWMNTKIGDDLVVGDIGYPTTPYSLNVFVGKSCYFFEMGKPCMFCGLNPTRHAIDDLVDKVTPESVAKMVEAVAKEDTFINQIYFVGANDSDYDRGYRRLISLVEAASKVAPKSWDIICTNFPPHDFALIDELKKAGATRVSFAIEAATKKVFRALAPAKESTYGYEKFLDVARYAAKVFPKGSYLSLIQGLDKKEDLMQFMREVVSEGIMPTMNIYYHSPYSQMGDKGKRPSVNYLYDVARLHQELFAKSNVRLFSYGADRHCLDWEAFRQMI